MELLADHLSRDKLLSLCFNEYLALDVFAVKISFQKGCVCKVGGALLPGKQDRLLIWCQNQRWKFFVKSRLYLEYKLWTRLIELKSSKPQRSVSPNQQSCDHNFQSDWSSALQQETFRYRHLSGCLTGTQGASLAELWVRLDEYQSWPERAWAGLRPIREQCALVPGLVKYLCGGLADTHKWVEALKKECEDRLTNYWLPRCQSGGQRVFDVFADVSYDMSCDLNEPFINGLRCNQNAGRPFEGYLMSTDNEHSIWLVKFWEALDWILLTQQNSGEECIVREAWRVWSVFIDQSGECSASKPTGLSADNKASLLRALRSCNHSSLVKALSLIQTDLLSGLKREWTAFLRCDQLLFERNRCPGDVPGLSAGICSVQHAQSVRQHKKRRKKCPNCVDSLTFDLKGTPLEPLNNLENLLSFEQYLYTVCGPQSQPLLNYQLWRALTKLAHTTHPQSHHTLAAHIHTTYLSTHAKRSVHLPDMLLEQVEEGSEFAQPTMPTLQAVSQFSSALLEVSVGRYLGEGQVGSEDEEGQSELWTLPPIDASSKKPRGPKVSSAIRLRAESQHLTLMLQSCDGPISHQLSAFSVFLEHQCPSSQQRQLTNNVRFWLEVNKFKAMFSDHTGSRVLYHKAEAIVDRYLDTTTPPWVKVTVTSDLANQIVSVVSDAHRASGWSLLERIYQLLERAQQMALDDMAPYWALFCAQYTSPGGSTISIPQAGLADPPSRQVSTLTLPPIPRVSTQTPLLSFSSLRGLKWKAGVHPAS